MKVYACLDCGSSYDTHLECCCPECGSGIINQYCISPKKPFESTKPHHLSNQSYKYRSDRKATGLAMDILRLNTPSLMITSNRPSLLITCVSLSH